MNNFNPESLPNAIQNLFELNHYEVHGPIQIHGAEIDLVAKPLGNPFGVPIYIEATIEYVENEKYGKDVGKLAMIGEIEPNAQRLIVSAKGFSLPVRERAEKSRILTLTYDELFHKFEQFGPYIQMYTSEGEQKDELEKLNEIYEEPTFKDEIGDDFATTYLNDWRNNLNKKGWLIIIGEYGTGKTALTKVLQYRWLNEYRLDPSLPLPIRMELRNFTRQFDARGLLHYFLDNNNLSHLSIDFVYSLIHTGRAILLLDGYDEMAQYLHARERRTCLEALAELSADGARGILTSRPNYFTEGEELEVFEILYTSLTHGNYYAGKQTQEILKREERIDKLLEYFIDRFERTLRDLTPDQTESLIKRALADDDEGQKVILHLLRRIYRTSQDGDAISLSGKPVIISYLLEVIENLKTAPETESTEALSEWEIYKLIIDQLMIRDLARSPEINPDKRRAFLQSLAVFLSRREQIQVNEADFKDLISKNFRRDLSRLPTESRSSQLERYFADLRSSATLTRHSDNNIQGWKFSHNTLREFLLTEYFLDGLKKENPVVDNLPISDAMRIFAETLPIKIRSSFVQSLSQVWAKKKGCGQLLSLIWNGLVPLYLEYEDPKGSCLRAITGQPIDLNSVLLSGINISTISDPTDLVSSNFARSTLTNINFSGAALLDANFSESTIENVIFTGANLCDTNFLGALIIDTEFSNAELDGSNFTHIPPDLISILIDDTQNDSNRSRLEAV